MTTRHSTPWDEEAAFLTDVAHPTLESDEKSEYPTNECPHFGAITFCMGVILFGDIPKLDLQCVDSYFDD
jgi:hypothetical protein